MCARVCVSVCVCLECERRLKSRYLLLQCERRWICDFFSNPAGNTASTRELSNRSDTMM